MSLDEMIAGFITIATRRCQGRFDIDRSARLRYVQAYSGVLSAAPVASTPAIAEVCFLPLVFSVPR